MAIINLYFIGGRGNGTWKNVEHNEIDRYAVPCCKKAGTPYYCVVAIRVDRSDVENWFLAPTDVGLIRNVINKRKIRRHVYAFLTALGVSVVEREEAVPTPTRS